MRFKKGFLTAAAVFLLCISTASTVFADEYEAGSPESNAIAAEEIQEYISSLTDSDTPPSRSSNRTPDTDLEETFDTPIPDYFGDGSFDTNGNLSLIKEQKIIYDSAEMQFIAVTTKDGHVFYILIDYTAIRAAENHEYGADARETVYFLNKVDTYDLYALLNEPSPVEDTESELYEEMYDTDTEEISSSNTNKSKNGDTVMYIVFAVALAVVGGGYYFLKVRPNKNKVKDDDDYDDFDFGDEPEINEDSE